MAAGMVDTAVTMAATTVVTMAAITEAITEATMGVSMECIAAAPIVVADDIGEAAGIPMALGPAGGGIRILAVGSGPATNHKGPPVDRDRSITWACD